MTCANCQKDIAAGSRFCYSCGAKQPETAASAPPPTYAAPKRFVRSTNDRKVAGVCAGVADYFDIDPALVRILWALSTLVPGPNVIAYIIIWIAADEGPTGVARTSATAVS
jgi:phage shock protein PspC (stress-responsive transcriptional regulator)